MFVQELKRDKKLRKFFEISDVPDTLQISEFLSRFNYNTYIKIVNSILINKPLKRREKLTFIANATPVNLDYNVNATTVLKNISKTGSKMELFILLWILYWI